MTQFSKVLQRGPAMLVLVAALSACGGGGGAPASTAPAPAPVPAPAPAALPTAVADTAAVSLNTSATLAVMANDTVTNGGTLALLSATAPAHGSATISGGSIVYTPAAGYIGPDSFSYTVGSGQVSASAQVSLTVSAGLTLNGRAPDAPNASVTVAVGPRVSTVTADATGNFSAPVTLDAAASMITITAQGTGAQSHVKLASLVGDSQLALKAAGAGSTLTAAMLAGLNVTNYSTALYAQAARQNGGMVPSTQAALDDATARVGASELLQMAALIRSMTGSPGVAPRLALPATAGDVLALVRNTALYTQVVTQLAPAVLYNEIGAMVGDTSLSSMPALAVPAVQALTFYGNEACCVTPAVELMLSPDGSATISADQQRVAGTWRRDSSALRLTLSTPVVHSEFVDPGSVPPTLVEVQTITREFVIRQVTGSADHGVVTITQAGTIHYPGNQRGDGTFESNSISLFSEWSRLAAPGDVSGSTLGGIPDLVNPQASGVGQLVLALAADGNASSPRLPGVASNWRTQDGKLVVDFGGGRSLTMARVALAANGEERWLARAAAGAGYAVFEFTAVRVQDGLAFTDASAVSRWRTRPALSEIGMAFYLNLAASHSAADEAQALDGTVTALGASTWAIDNGAVVITAYRLPDGSPAAACPAAVACTIRMQRSWTLLRNDAGGVFVLEKARFSDTDIRYRINRYERSGP